MGKVPAPPRLIRDGRSGRARCTGRACPPVPKVALASPGRVQPWPTREACWSPAMPQMGGAPGSAAATPSAPDESTIVGIIGNGIRSFSSSGSSHPIVAVDERRHGGVGGVGHVERVAPGAAPPESVQATQLSTVPKQSSPRSARDRSGSTSSRMAITLVADALGASRIPSAWRTRQVPTVRRSCQPMPGATGRPGGALPDDARRSLVGDADAGDRTSVLERGAGDLEDGVGHARRIELHQARCRRVGQQGDVVFVLDGGVGSDDGGPHARGADVDDQDAARRPWLMPRGRSEGRGEAELARD